MVASTAGYWDDGGQTPGDGWGATCAVETGWTCTLGDLTTASAWNEICGDGKVMSPTTGYCDDGNTIPGDGWSDICEVETGYDWKLGDSTSASIWTDLWGDGKIIISNPSSTMWDDGNTNDGDGWSSTCIVESGWACSSGNSTTASTCIDKWGDGIAIQSDVRDDYCDDGNTNNSDGWSSSWAVETNYACSLANSTIASICTQCTDSSCLEYERSSTCIWKRRKKTQVVMSQEVETISTASQVTIGGTAAATIGVSVLSSFVSSYNLGNGKPDAVIQPSNSD